MSACSPSLFLWIDDRFADFRDDFLKTASLLTRGEIHETNFDRQDRATARINRWISEQTGGRPVGRLNPDDPALESRSVPGVVDEVALAVAVTRVVGRSFGCSYSGVPLFPIHATHPFLYFITHNQSQSVLFAGWVGRP